MSPGGAALDAGPVTMARRAFDPSRGQFVAESLLVLMRRNLPRLAEDPNAVLIGITQQDMYIAGRRWRYAFSYRSENNAVVSTAHNVFPSHPGRLPHHSEV